MAHAGKRWMHRRDDRPEKNPPPIHDARVLEPLREVPQSNAPLPDSELFTDVVVGETLVTNQPNETGELATVSSDEDNLINPQVSPEFKRIANNNHIAPEQLAGGTEHIESPPLTRAEPITPRNNKKNRKSRNQG